MSSIRITRFEIEYTCRWSGQTSTHINTNSVADAGGWAKSLAQENGCKAVCVAVHEDGTRKHIVSEGNDKR